MSLLSRDEKINDLVREQAVCLVGLSGCLVGTKIGSYIDSYDIVSRVGDFSPLDYLNDYGIRTDILFHAFSDIGAEIDEFRIFVENNYNFYHQIQLIVAPAVTQKPYGPFEKDSCELYKLYAKNFEKKQFSGLSTNDLEVIKKELNGDFNTGMVAILMLLACEIKSLFITGFSFYWENEQIPPKSCYWPGSVYASYCNGGIPKANHNQKHQKEYFIEKILKQNEDKIMIDSFLRDTVLKIDYKNVKYLV